MSEISVPGYEIRGVLGQGGFGVVYRAQQMSVGREVALKVDNRVLLSDRDRRRFMREVTAAGALSGHPHVVPVYDAGLLPDARPYMVLELCPGGSLKGRLLAPADARDVGVRIADALAAAHSQGVLHRWETYAVAPIPDDSMTYDYRDLSRHPTVKRVCASKVLLASRNAAGKADGRAWVSEVMPPSAARFEAGTRFYRCVGGVEATEVRRAFFHR
ncbi:protein kinase [Nonomuraea sp. RK-328]|nr:protein kinase [Nonomuraea sp. RK-328]